MPAMPRSRTDARTEPLAVRWALQGRLTPGAAGLATLEHPIDFLTELAAVGVKAATFAGTA